MSSDSENSDSCRSSECKKQLTQLTITNEENPLLNSVILHLLIDYIPKNHWGNVRLVNKTWHSELLHRWRDKMTVSLGSDLIENIETHNPDSNELDPYQYAKYPFRGCCAYQTLEISQLPFWEKTGSWLQRLHLVKTRIPCLDFLERVLFEMTPNLMEFKYQNCKLDRAEEVEENPCLVTYNPPAKVQRNLKFLSVQTEKLFENDDYHLFPIRWINIFSVFQNIEKIRVRFVPIPKSTLQLTNIIKAIGVVRAANDNQVLNIKEFDTDADFTSVFDKIFTMELITSLCQLSLPLSTVVMSFAYVFDAGLIQMIRCHPSIRELICSCHDSPDKELNFFMQFPYHIFPQGLTKLKCRGNIFPNLGFLQFTPNLKELEVVNDNCDDVVRDLKKRSVAPLVYLTTLNYFILNGEANENLMQCLVELMPNVRKLSVPVSFEGFSILGENWGNVERVFFFLKSVTEQQFLDSVIRLKWARFIGVVAVDADGRSVLGDESVYKGFLQLPYLVEINAMFSTTVSDQAMDALRSKIPDTSCVQIEEKWEDDYFWAE